MNSLVEIQLAEAATPTKTEEYWTTHNIRPEPFKTKEESLNDIQIIFNTYPFHKEFMNLYALHEGETILDYGCGPGRDIVGFLAHSNAKKVIGMDVSMRSLELTNHRLSLHGFNPADVSLIKLSDRTPVIPLGSDSVDYIQCSGVLHHTSYPVGILGEFYRILKPGGKACIMVYNRDSIWFHLWVGYVRGIIHRELKNKTIEEIWTTYSDCGAPISLTYRTSEFVDICINKGFATMFIGGYISITEVDVYKRYSLEAMVNKHTLTEGKDFLRNVTLDTDGFPMHKGKYAGMGGTYLLCK